MMTTKGISPKIQVQPQKGTLTQSESQGLLPWRVTSSVTNPFPIWYLFFARAKGFEDERGRA